MPGVDGKLLREGAPLAVGGMTVGVGGIDVDEGSSRDGGDSCCGIGRECGCTGAS